MILNSLLFLHIAYEKVIKTTMKSFIPKHSTMKQELGPRFQIIQGLERKCPLQICPTKSQK